MLLLSFSCDSSPSHAVLFLLVWFVSFSCDSSSSSGVILLLLVDSSLQGTVSRRWSFHEQCRRSFRCNSSPSIVQFCSCFSFPCHSSPYHHVIILLKNPYHMKEYFHGQCSCLSVFPFDYSPSHGLWSCVSFPCLTMLIFFMLLPIRLFSFVVTLLSKDRYSWHLVHHAERVFARTAVFMFLLCMFLLLCLMMWFFSFPDEPPLE